MHGECHLRRNHLRFHETHAHRRRSRLAGLKAERCALRHADVLDPRRPSSSRSDRHHPADHSSFPSLLNLAFSLQAAYAAPLILLAQTRQADRDKALSEADVQHREALAAASLERQELATRQSAQILELLERNTALTKMTQELSARIEALTAEMHRTLCQQ